MSIPFVNLDLQYRSIKSEIALAIDSILESKDFINGNEVAVFSKNFSEKQKSRFSVGCSNGTSAITVALRALGIKPGDEIITVANSFFATPEAIEEVGAKVVFVDCDPETYGINVGQIEQLITKKTKAIIPVHLYGNPVDMDAISNLARKHNLFVVEDCAQAHLATWGNKGVGTFGDLGTFSFYPGKNLGAYGDAGALTMQSQELYEYVSKYVNHGRLKKYEHDFCAGNFRMDGIQAAILNVKLKYINEWTEKRINLANLYQSRLASEGFKTIKVSEKAKCVYHIFLAEVSNRDEVVKHFESRGIGCGVHYPVPLHLQPALKHLGYAKNSFPHTEWSSERILSLPMFAELKNEEVEIVLSEFLKVAKR